MAEDRQQKQINNPSAQLQAVQRDIIARNLTRDTVQSYLAARLRKEAIAHLSNSKQPVAAAFRAEYHHTGENKSHQSFLQQQAQPGVWGTYIEAAALGEQYDCSIVVVAKESAASVGTEFPVYRTEDPTRPIIRLTNIANTHWQYGHATRGDGNCLYNAFSQGIRDLGLANTSQYAPSSLALPTVEALEAKAVQIEAAPETVESKVEVVQKEPSVPVAPFFKEALRHRVEASQRALLGVVSKAPTPSELAADVLKEQGRIANLPESEQRQIQQDYALSLKIAAGDETAGMTPSSFIK